MAGDVAISAEILEFIVDYITKENEDDAHSLSEVKVGNMLPWKQGFIFHVWSSDKYCVICFLLIRQRTEANLVYIIIVIIIVIIIINIV